MYHKKLLGAFVKAGHASVAWRKLTHLTSAYLTTKRLAMEQAYNDIITCIHAYIGRFTIFKLSVLTDLRSEVDPNDKLRDLVLSRFILDICRQGWATCVENEPDFVEFTKEGGDD